MRLQGTAMDNLNRMATDVFECPMCSGEDIETTYKKDFDKHICRECCYEWIEQNETELEL